MSRAERAKEYFLEGYNCSQAVALAFSDLVALEKESLLKVSLPFGGGFGRMRLTCGCVSGMGIIIGLLFGETGHSAENKKEVYGLAQELCRKFKEEYGSLLCGELLSGKVPVEIGGEAEVRTQEYYQKRPCAEMVAYSAKILEDFLMDKGLL